MIKQKKYSDKYLKGVSEWQKRNPEKVRAYKKKYRDTHKDKIAKYNDTYNKEWYKKNIEKRKVYNKNYGKKWREKNSEYVKQYNAKYKSENREYFKKYIKLYSAKYRKTIKGRLVAINHSQKRRTKTIGLTDITAEWLNELFNKTIYCELCNKKMNRHKRYPLGKTLDHIIPINVGGTHTKNNVRFICAKCNISRPKDGRDIKQLKLAI